MIPYWHRNVALSFGSEMTSDARQKYIVTHQHFKQQHLLTLNPLTFFSNRPKLHNASSFPLLSSKPTAMASWMCFLLTANSPYSHKLCCIKSQQTQNEQILNHCPERKFQFGFLQASGHISINSSIYNLHLRSVSISRHLI